MLIFTFPQVMESLNQLLLTFLKKRIEKLFGNVEHKLLLCYVTDALSLGGRKLIYDKHHSQEFNFYFILGTSQVQISNKNLDILT
jgi:hypothetical protein